MCPFMNIFFLIIIPPFLLFLPYLLISPTLLLHFLYLSLHLISLPLSLLFLPLHILFLFPHLSSSLVPLISPPTPILRRYVRTTHHPPYLADYICRPLPISNSSASMTAKVSTAALNMLKPQFYQQTTSYPTWQEIMLK